jgi:hypothetical protein
MTTAASDKKIKISKAVNVTLYELLHCSIMRKYILVVCGFYGTVNGYGGTNERRGEKEVSRGLYKVRVYLNSN